MKKAFLKTSVLAGIASLLFSFSAWKTGTLTDITKPYLGEYECKSATYGKKDMLEDISSVILQLKADETFVLSYKDKHGKTRKETGTYQYDKERNTLHFFWEGKGELKRDFPLEKGCIQGSVKMGNKILSIRFEQK